MKVFFRINWSAVAVVITAIATILLFIWTISPDEGKLACVAFSIVIMILLLAAYFASNVIAGAVHKNGRLLRMLAFAFVIPVSHFVFYERSLNSFLLSGIEAICIILIVSSSREWRTIRPLRSPSTKDDPFQWGGIIDDEVGRGPGRNKPDGAPDAKFKLRLPKSQKVITEIILRRLKPNSDHYTMQIWRTGKHRANWILGIIMGDHPILPNRNDELNIPLTGDTEISLYASDNWRQSNWFNSGQSYEVEVNYKDVIGADYYTLTIP